jgi:uncharacterized membrane protein
LAIHQINKALDQLQERISPDRKKESTAYLRAVILGSVAGSRSTLPLTLLAWEKDPRKSDTLLPSRLLASDKAKPILTTATIGEMIADKLPFTPSRLDPLPFAGRVIVGGLAGATIAYRFRESAVVGAVLGSLGAAFGTVAGYYSRHLLDERTAIPDPVWGITEDAIATGLGLLATS